MKNTKNIKRIPYREAVNPDAMGVIRYKTRNLAIIGSNGSGKSSLMRYIKREHYKNATIIASQKILSFQQGSVRGKTQSELMNNKELFSHLSGNNISQITTSFNSNNYIQSDFMDNLELLKRKHTSHQQQIVDSLRNHRARNINLLSFLEKMGKSELDMVLDVWGNVLKGTMTLKEEKIRINSGFSFVYDIEELSDGERVALYILTKVVLADPNSTILIDEPETFLNPALVVELMDECEKLRTDCDFIYFSHNLDFIKSRNDCALFWVKNCVVVSSFNEQPLSDQYTIEEIKSEEIPDEVIMRIIGTKRRKILFVEGESDKKLYSKLYPEFEIFVAHGVGDVIRWTKALNRAPGQFNKEKYFGLIDRDFRSENAIDKLEKKSIFSTPYAIYENLFCNRDVVNFAMTYWNKKKSVDNAYDLFEQKIKEKLSPNGAFAKKYREAEMKERVGQEIKSLSANNDIESINIPYDATASNQNINSMRSGDVENILKKYNGKGDIIKIANSCFAGDWHEKVLDIFNDPEEADKLRSIFQGFMPEIK